MEIDNTENSALCDYLEKLGLAGRYWLAGGSEELAPVLEKRFPKVSLYQGIPDTEESLEDCSVLLLGEDEEAFSEIFTSYLLATENRPLIILTGDQFLPESDLNRLHAIGYKLPASSSEDGSFQVVEHAELEHKAHFDVAGYWESRYASGKDSGSGSYGRLARFKARFLNEFVHTHQVSSVFELGCGDGAQLTLAEYPQYTGLDISRTVIEQCRTLFADDPSKRFEVYDPSRFEPEQFQAELGLSLDVVFHLSNDRIYKDYLDHLFAASSRFVIIYSNNDEGSRPGVNEEASYVRFRNFLADVAQWHPEWKLVSARPNRYPFSVLNPSNTSFADFFVFSKEAEEQGSDYTSPSYLLDYSSEKVLNALMVADENRKSIANDVSAANKKIDALTKTVNEQRSEKDLKAQLENTIEQYNTAVEQVQELRQQLADADQNYQNAWGEAQRLTGKLEKTVDDCEKLRSEVDDLQEQLRNNAQDYEAANSKASELEKEKAELQERLKTAIAQQKQARQQLNALRASDTYKAGLYVRAASGSVAGIIKLPVRLLRLRRHNKHSASSRSRLKERLYRVVKLLLAPSIRLSRRKQQGEETTTTNWELKDQFEWQAVSVQPGQEVTITAAVNYYPQNGSGNRKAVMVIKPFDGSGNELGVPCGKLAKSKSLNGYFKYIPCTNGERSELHRFKVPPNVERVEVGFRRFHAASEERIVLSRLGIDIKPGEPEPAGFTPPSQQAAEISILGWPDYPDNGKPYAIGVMDEFTTGCFEQELNLIQPRPDNWYALAEKYPPALFFIESAWKGNGGSWQYRVGDYANKPGHEVAHMAQYAREKGIPSVFWNKEDPVHHKKFMASAKLVDHIFTTDANMCQSYREHTGNSNVYALPFAAQPALHKPAPLAGRRARACFAGSWYGNRHAERGEAMQWLLKAANRHGLDIFDRNYGTGIFPFPDEYQDGIRGSLPYKELCAEYSRYRVFLNVNSVTDSPTMFSRRVFELMACGTPVVSTWARGIEELFESDAVWLVHNEREAEEAIHTLLTDDAEWRRRSLAGIREVYSRHTYAHRLNEMFEKIGVDQRIPTEPELLLVARAGNKAEQEALLAFAEHQSYRQFQLLIEADNEADTTTIPEGVELVSPGYLESDSLAERASHGPAIGWLLSDAKYGAYYLRDLVNAMLYQPEATGWAKALDHDAFAFNEPAVLHGALWNSDTFLSQWQTADPVKTLQRNDLFVADSGEFGATHSQPNATGV